MEFIGEVQRKKIDLRNFCAFARTGSLERRKVPSIQHEVLRKSYEADPFGISLVRVTLANHDQDASCLLTLMVQGI